MPQRRLNQQGRFAIGVDYGTNSVRALVVDVADGREVASGVYDYPQRRGGHFAGPKGSQSGPAEPGRLHRRVLTVGGRGRARRRSGEPGFRPEHVVGIGVDTTGSTPIPVDRQGMPLALHPEFRDNLAAHAWLWKDHTSFAEAAEITEKARRDGDGYLAKCGGVYSSEWYWSKILHCRRTAPKVFEAAYSWVELADFVPAYITGNLDPEKLPRGHLRRRPQGDVPRTMGRAAQQASSCGDWIRRWSRLPSTTRRRP